LIETFRHKGLRQLFEDDNPKGVRADHLRRLRQILALLDAASVIGDLDYPIFRLHPLKGELNGFWSLKVNGNWRVIFRFQDGTASDLDLVDYH
jgi:toxin HigB-1